MNKVAAQNSKLIPMLLMFFTLLAGLFYCTKSNANTTTTQPVQLAAYIGFHVNNNGYYRHRRHQRNYYWTHWRYV